MTAWSPKSNAALAQDRARLDAVTGYLRGHGYRDVEIFAVEERNADVYEALFTTPIVTAQGVTRREARRAWICRSSGLVQILDNWDVP